MTDLNRTIPFVFDDTTYDKLMNVIKHYLQIYDEIDEHDQLYVKQCQAVITAYEVFVGRKPAPICVIHDDHSLLNGIMDVTQYFNHIPQAGSIDEHRFDQLCAVIEVYEKQTIPPLPMYRDDDLSLRDGFKNES